MNYVAENSGDGVTLKNLIARGKLLDINEESFKVFTIYQRFAIK